MTSYCFRLIRGQDLLEELKKFVAQKNIAAATVASAVGCVTCARIRDASGVDIHELKENMEIVSLTGTLSKNRTHLHIALSKKDLSTIGGHLLEGCLINTTAEIVLLGLDNWEFASEFDATTGYDELVIKPTT